MATTTKMPAATHSRDSRPGAKTQATHQRGIPAAGLLGIPAVRLGTVVERSTDLADGVLWYDLLRKVIGSTAKSLRSRNGAQPQVE